MHGHDDDDGHGFCVPRPRYRPNDHLPGRPREQRQHRCRSGCDRQRIRTGNHHPRVLGPDLHVINDGTIQVNVGNTPTTGGSSAALSIVSAGTNLTYAGTGDIFNLGTGDGLFASTGDDGSITVNLGGSVSSVTGDAVDLEVNGTSGNISLTTTAGETIRAGNTDTGLEADIFNAANAGTITIVNNAAIGGTVVNTMSDGINATTAGTGAVSVTNNGPIGSALDRAQSNGIQADITNALSAATLSVTGSGAIFSVGDGIFVDNAGTGTTTVNYTGAIDTTARDGIDASGTTGPLSVTSGGAITVASTDEGIATFTTTGNQTISVGGNVTSGGDGVNAKSTSGTIAVTTTGGADITATDDAIDVTSDGNRTVTVGAGSVVTAAISPSNRRPRHNDHHQRRYADRHQCHHLRRLPPATGRIRSPTRPAASSTAGSI